MPPLSRIVLGHAAEQRKFAIYGAYEQSIAGHYHNSGNNMGINQQGTLASTGLPISSLDAAQLVTDRLPWHAGTNQGSFIKDSFGVE